MQVAHRTHTPTNSSRSREVRRRNGKISPAGGIISHGDGKATNGRPSGLDGRPSPPNGRPTAPQPQVAGVSTGASAGGEHHVTLDHLDESSGARLLFSDIRVACLLLNEARHRTIERLFGVSRDQSNIVTLIAVGVLAEAAHDKAEHVLRGPGGPTRTDAALGSAALKGVVHGIAGPSSDTFGILVAIALLGGLSGPALGRSLHGIRALSHRTRLSFNHRYGHLGPTVAVEGEHHLGTDGQ